MNLKSLGRWCAMLCATALAACSGGGDAPPAADPTPAQAASVTGVITGFGSLIVNGQRYESDGAAVTREGRAASLADLRVGQVVSLRAQVDAQGRARATAVERERLAQGAVQAVDATAGTLTVAGQRFTVDNDTAFDRAIAGRSLAGLAIGDRVEVDGFVSATGAARATRIERARDDDRDIDVSGAIVSLDALGKRLTVGAQQVDYAAAVLQGVDAAGLAVGDLVKVRGRTLAADGTLKATVVRKLRGVPAGRGGDDADAEGLVTRFVSAADFDVAGQKVTTNQSTRFVNGGAADLAVDVRVDVDGKLDAAGVLVAQRVVFKRSATLKIEAGIEAVDAAAGTLKLLGLTVAVGADTRREDDRDEGRRFDLGRLRVGDWVEVSGYPDPAVAGRVIATRIEREDGGGQVELKGTASEVAAPGFKVFGVSIVTAATTQFRDDDQTLTAAAFFATAAGRRVEVKGSWDGSALQAARVELDGAGIVTPPPPPPPPPANRAPVANAGAAQTVAVGTAVTLDGRASSDPDGNTLSFAWTLQAPAGSSAALSGATSAQPRFTPDVAGSYSATLTVSDGTLSSSATVTVTAQASAPPPPPPPANRAPVANAGSARTVTTGTAVTLDGRASSDPDGDTLSFSWTLQRPAASTATLAGATTAQPSFTPDAAGTYTATLTVRDGTLSATATVVITAQAPAPAIDGAALWTQRCQGCHGAITGGVGRRSVSAAAIQDAIDSNRGGMGFLSTLTAAQVQAIADAARAANP